MTGLRPSTMEEDELSEAEVQFLEIRLEQMMKRMENQTKKIQEHQNKIWDEQLELVSKLAAQKQTNNYANVIVSLFSKTSVIAIIGTSLNPTTSTGPNIAIAGTVAIPTQLPPYDPDFLTVGSLEIVEARDEEEDTALPSLEIITDCFSINVALTDNKQVDAKNQVMNKEIAIFDAKRPINQLFSEPLVQTIESILTHQFPNLPMFLSIAGLCLPSRYYVCSTNKKEERGDAEELDEDKGKGTKRPPPKPPPQEIGLRFSRHCKDCAIFAR